MKTCSETGIADFFHAKRRTDRFLVLGAEQEYQRHNTQDTYLEEVQQDAIACRYLFTAKLLCMFRASIAPFIRST